MGWCNAAVGAYFYGLLVISLVLTTLGTSRYAPGIGLITFLNTAVGLVGYLLLVLDTFVVQGSG